MFDEIKDAHFVVTFYVDQPWSTLSEGSTALMLLLRDVLFPDKRMERLAAVARVVEIVGDIDTWTVGYDGKPFHFSKALNDTDYFSIVRITH